MVKEIPLTQGKVALVDDEDYELVSQYKWCVHSKTRHCYALSTNIPQILMHRLIMSAKQGEIIDHINHNGLDNRRKNLRIASRSLNKANSRFPIDNVSGFVGVFFDKRKSKWILYVTYNGGTIQSGICKDPATAALVRDEIARRFWGSDILLNFPNVEPTKEILELADRVLSDNNRESNKTSKFRGVGFRRKHWRARITYQDTRIEISNCGDEISAALIYDELLRQLYGEHVYLNFPDVEPTPEIIEKAHLALRRHGL